MKLNPKEIFNNLQNIFLTFFLNFTYFSNPHQTSPNFSILQSSSNQFHSSPSSIFSNFIFPSPHPAAQSQFCPEKKIFLSLAREVFGSLIQINDMSIHTCSSRECHEDVENVKNSSWHITRHALDVSAIISICVHACVDFDWRKNRFERIFS